MVPCHGAKSDQHKHPQEAEPDPHRDIWDKHQHCNDYHCRHKQNTRPNLYTLRSPHSCSLHLQSVFLREGESPNLRYERYCRERDRERVGVLDFLGGRRRRRRRRRVGRYCKRKRGRGVC
ncbi:hypothetical protein AMTRI_Chr03g53120 [Amborella trichopoda]